MTDVLDFKEVACKIYSILLDIPETRDDDRKLLFTIWSKEAKASTVEELFKEIRDGSLSHAETIFRIRRKLQEKHTNLRGEKWDDRHKVEPLVVEQLSFFDNW